MSGIALLVKMPKTLSFRRCLRRFLKASEPLETFSTWLLVGTAAVASFLITNADKLLPFMGRPGYLTCGALLSFSCVFGLVSRIFALRCKIQIETGAAVRRTFAEHLAKHQKEGERLKKAPTFGVSG